MSVMLLANGCISRQVVWRANDPGIPEVVKSAGIPIFLPRTVLEFQGTGTMKTTSRSLLYDLATKPQPTFGVNEVYKAATALNVRLNPLDPPPEQKSGDAISLTRTAAQQLKVAVDDEHADFGFEALAKAADALGMTNTDWSSALGITVNQDGTIFRPPNDELKKAARSTIAVLLDSATTPPLSLATVRAAATELGLTLNEKDDTTQFSFKEPVLLATGERDPEQFFIAQLKGGPFVKLDFDVQFTAAGVPSSVSSGIDNQTLDFTVKSVEVATGIASNVAASLFSVRSSIRFSVTPSKSPEQSFLEKVKAALQDVRGKKLDLISNASAEMSDVAFSKRLDAIQAEEDALAAYFTGEIEIKTFKISAKIAPSKAQENKAWTLFSYSKGKGFRSGDPDVYFGPIPPGAIYFEPAADEVPITMTLQRDLEKSSFDRLAEASDFGEKGLPYRVPAQCVVNVFRGLSSGPTSQLLLRSSAYVAQLGFINHLPTHVSSKNVTFHPQYYDDTGALKQLTVSAQPFSSTALDPLLAASKTAGEARKANAARRDELAQKNGELAKTTTEADLLEQKVRIKDYQDKISGKETGKSD